MEFSNFVRRRRNNKLNGDIRQFQYPHGLQFYTVPPNDIVSLEEFEELAVERLKVLRAVESITLRQSKNSKDYHDALEAALRKLNLKAVYKTSVDDCNENDFEDRRKDHISHFILRLAYCKSEDLRRWFISQEVDLFRFRFNQEKNESVQKFLNLNNLHYQPISSDTKRTLREYLVASTFGKTTAKIQDEHFFQVPFTEALDLVRSRKVYLQKGYAYVPQSELVSIILNVFRISLSHALTVTARILPNLNEEDRLLPMLNNLNQCYTGQDYNNKKINVGQVTPDMVDGLSRQSFPLCMRNLQEALVQNHHHKHWGRLQYGLFLKGIGLSLQDALMFWRKGFLQKTDSDQFDKKYSYGIRYNYGKEGRRADYTPYSCLKIIMSNSPGPGDSHGCPFRHFDIDVLKQRLQAYKISPSSINEILDYVQKGHYQIACTKYFEFTHNIDAVDQVFSHPNQYFENSQKLLNGGKIVKSENRDFSKTKPVILKETTKLNSDVPNSSQDKDDFEDTLTITDEMEQALQAMESENN